MKYTTHNCKNLYDCKFRVTW